MNNILCIGNASYDITAYLEDYPEENYKYRTKDFNECTGGPAANAATLLAQWGLKTFFIGTTGDDIYGDMVKRS